MGDAGPAEGGTLFCAVHASADPFPREPKFTQTVAGGVSG